MGNESATHKNPRERSKTVPIIEPETNNQIKEEPQEIIENDETKYEKFPYLLCPVCYSRIPFFELFLDNKIERIKLTCTKCPKAQCSGSSISIMTLEDYIKMIENHTHDLKKEHGLFCHIHTNEYAKMFCSNCEKWLCIKCYNEHKIDDFVCHENMTTENAKPEKCMKHMMDKSYFCYECRYFLCKKCCFNHTVIHKEMHKFINYDKYFIPEKINNKQAKFRVYNGEIKPIIKQHLDKLYKAIRDMEEDNPDISQYKNDLDLSVSQSNSINDLLSHFINIIFKNIDYLDGIILNKKLIVSMIVNTKFNINEPRIRTNEKEADSIEERVNYFINYFKKNYINSKISAKIYQTDLLPKTESPVIILNKIDDTKFVSVSKGCSMQIWSAQTKEMLVKVKAHSNKILSCLCLSDDEHIATISDDRTLKIWDNSSLNLEYELNINEQIIKIFELKHNTEMRNHICLLTMKCTIDVYDYKKKEKVLSKDISASIEFPTTLYQLNNGNLIVSATNLFVIFDKDYEKKNSVLIGNENPLVFLEVSNGDILTGLSNSEIFAYDSEFNYRSRMVGHTGRVTCLVQINEARVMSGSSDTNIILWDINNYEKIECFINNKYGINDMIRMDDNQIVCCSEDEENSVSIWQMEEMGKEEESLEQIEKELFGRVIEEDKEEVREQNAEEMEENDEEYMYFREVLEQFDKCKKKDKI